MKKPTTPAKPPEAKPYTIPLDRIEVPDERQRTFQRAAAEAIAGTLPDMGLLQPIGVAIINDRGQLVGGMPMGAGVTGTRFRLVYGLHRFEAVKMAGWTTIPARVLDLHEADLEASAGLHEAFENVLRAELSALDRMSHLSALKAAHDELYPEHGKGGRPRIMTRQDEENRPVLGRFLFSKGTQEVFGLSRSRLKALLKVYADLSPKSRLRLRGSRLENKQSEIVALSRLEPTMQDRVLDYILADQPEAATVDEAHAKIMNDKASSATDRRIQRYHATILAMPEPDRDAFFDGIRDAIKDYVQRKGLPE